MHIPENKTIPTEASVNDFLSSISEARQAEARTLMKIMMDISGRQPVLWGPSIIGFGSKHYKYESGREGDMPELAFSPRKASMTIYIAEGFNHYGELLSKLGKHKASVSCLYIQKLDDIDLSVLHELLSRSYELAALPATKPATVEAYVSTVPAAARRHFDTLRNAVWAEIPNALEVVSYSVIGYKVDDNRARVFISGWKDHVAMYPIPKDRSLRNELAPFAKGKGTLWFPLDAELPLALIRKVVRSLAQ